MSPCTCTMYINSRFKIIHMYMYKYSTYTYMYIVCIHVYTSTHVHVHIHLPVKNSANSCSILCPFSKRARQWSSELLDWAALWHNMRGGVYAQVVVHVHVHVYVHVQIHFVGSANTHTCTLYMYMHKRTENHVHSIFHITCHLYTACMPMHSLLYDIHAGGSNADCNGM